MAVSLHFLYGCVDEGRGEKTYRFNLNSNINEDKHTTSKDGTIGTICYANAFVGERSRF